MEKVLLGGLSGALRWDRKDDDTRKKIAVHQARFGNQEDDDTIPSAKTKVTQTRVISIFHTYLNKIQMFLL